MTDAVPTRLVTSAFRASYPHLVTARAVNEGDKPRFSLAMLVPPESEIDAIAKELGADPAALKADRTRFMGELAAAIKFAKHKKFGDNPPGNLKSAVYRSDETGKIVENGAWTLIRAAAPADKRPPVLLSKRDPGTGKWLPCPQEDMYAGCWSRASIDVYAYDMKMSKGVTCGLNFVQKLADGDRLDNRPSADDVFGDVEFGGAGASGGQSDADALFG